MSRRDTAAAVLALLRRRAALNSQSASAPVAHPLAGSSLNALDWRAVIAFASAHFVLAALAPALPSQTADDGVPVEAAEFLAAITQSNAGRNRMLLTRLAEVCRRLSEIGVVPVALKGAAFLVEDQSAAAEWRFMQDLDLLIPAESLDASVAALMALGYRAATSGYDPAAEAHYPPLVSPCGTFSIELHTRLFARGDFGLTPADITREAVTASIAGFEIQTPSPRHRLGHLLVHAQVHNRFFPADRLVLKDLLDLAMLDGRHAEVATPAVVAALFGHDAQVHRATLALFDTWRACLTTCAGPHAYAGAWGERALARLEWSHWRALLATPFDVVRLELHRIRFETGHLARRWETIASPARLARTASVWSAKQRQRLWG